MKQQWRRRVELGVEYAASVEKRKKMKNKGLVDGHVVRNGENSFCFHGWRLDVKMCSQTLQVDYLVYFFFVRRVTTSA